MVVLPEEVHTGKDNANFLLGKTQSVIHTLTDIVIFTHTVTHPSLQECVGQSKLYFNTCYDQPPVTAYLC